MNSKNKGSITVSAPGRICLFGEHQDYLGLPVVAAAINLRAKFTAIPGFDNNLNILMPDTAGSDTIDPTREQQYGAKRDYLRSGVNVMLREGFKFGRGYDISLRSEIPIGKGCSSSSAIEVAWIALLSRIATEGPGPLDQERTALLAYRAEVEEFGEPGGMMDHYTSALGGVQLIKTEGRFATVKLMDDLPCKVVLGDSFQPKDTTGVLGYVRSRAEEGMRIIREKIPGANWHTVGGAAAKKAVTDAPEDIQRAVAGNLANRDITRDFLRMYEGGHVDPEQIGILVTEHHEYLKSYLGISTDRINNMVIAALENGAWGAKINGSGGGGCMFALAPEDKAEDIALAFMPHGGGGGPVDICDGVKEG